MQKQKSPPDRQTIAAIDLGSNSFHLSLVRVVDGTLQPLVTDKRMVRFAEGLDADNRLSHPAMQRGLDTLKDFAEILRGLPNTNMRTVATHTLRRAHNRNEFLRLARRHLQVPIEVISGDEEARLIYQGVAHTTHLDGRRLVIDIGGGSTELAIGDQFTPQQLSSQPLGCVTATRRYFADGTLTESAFQAAELAAERRLEVIEQRFKHTGWQVAIGCSGSIKALAHYCQAQTRTQTSDTPTPLNAAALAQARQTMLAAGHVRKLAGVEEHRREVLPAGLAILRALFARLEIKEMSLSDAALREGVLYELASGLQHQDVRERTVANLTRHYRVDRAQVRRVTRTADALLAGVAAPLQGENWPWAQRLLRWAAALHEVGLQINRRAIQRHSAYIIGHSELPGFSRELQKILATLLQHYRKGFDRRRFADFTLLSPPQISLLVALLRLAVLLNIRRLDPTTPPPKCQISEGQIAFTFTPGWLTANPLTEKDLQAESRILAANGWQLEYR
ncbi:MAG: exopolyphosphatase [Cellvibrionales bacterium]|nr:exopolyphosphatase [Cellvibrionales bacterium]